MKTALPEDFGVTSDMRSWAELKTPTVDIEREHESFCLYWTAHGKKMASWTATWKMWMKRAPQFKGAALRSPDELFIVTLMRQYTEKGFRRAFLHESSGMYTAAFEAWRDRDLPQRDTDSLLKLVRRGTTRGYP
jgi:hypothetical protein